MRWGRPTISMSPGDRLPWFKSEVAQSCPALYDPMDCIAYQSPLSIGFSRQKYWGELPFPSPGDLPDSGIEPGISCIIGRYFTIWATGAVTLVQSLVLLPAFLWSWSVYLTLPRLIVLIFKEELIEIIVKINEMVHHESLDMYMAHRKHSVIARNRKNGCQNIGTWLGLQVTQIQVLQFDIWVNWHGFSHHIWIIWISTILHPNNSIQVIE